MSDTPIDRYIPIFTNEGVPVSFLVPTQTGYDKSIMDATGPVRSFLRESGIHDYANQKQGPENKVCIRAFFVTETQLIETKASLYRPNTKKGDPRIWFSNLKSYCKPMNLLALTSDKDAIYVFNLSNGKVVNSLLGNGFALSILKHSTNRKEDVSIELLKRLDDIHNEGFIKGVSYDDTNVGTTLEALLGISRNSSKGPDFKGIELKASRIGERVDMNRVNLFSQCPDWKKSPIHTAVDLLNQYGYWADNKGKPRFNLYCTVQYGTPNGQGLFFDYNHDSDILSIRGSKNSSHEEVVLWDCKTLMDRTLEKHHETFWVKAESKFENGIEYFRYDTVIHTKDPVVQMIPDLIENRIITMDFTLHFKNEERTKTRDHGYLFKIKPSSVGMLFPEPQTHILGHSVS